MKVRVSTPSRLHFGIMNMSGLEGRRYGSIGLAIDRPRMVLEAEIGRGFSCDGPMEEEVKAAVGMIIQRLSIADGVRMRILEVIPRHVGLGSGTQAALAAATAVCKLYGLSVPVESLAEMTGRGRVSGIGVYAFKLGGFIVDGGHGIGDGRHDGEPPPLLFRGDFPSDWCFVVGIPRDARGFSGPSERRVMEQTHSRQGIAKSIISKVFMKMAPAILEEDITAFGEALSEVQRLVGTVFRDIQGGRFADRTTKHIRYLSHVDGVYGTGQSSWGPTFYALTYTDEAEEVADALKAHLTDDTRVLVTYPENLSALIETV